jgi:hypothetical protein
MNAARLAPELLPEELDVWSLHFMPPSDRRKRGNVGNTAICGVSGVKGEQDERKCVCFGPTLYIMVGVLKKPNQANTNVQEFVS